jgi:uncharacterized protein (DUF302 family)
MYYIKTSPNSVDDTARQLEAHIKEIGFGVLHVYDFQQILKSKGFDLPHECRVFEVCNPAQAVNVLNVDMDLNMALPCRVSVYEQDGETRVGMVRPTKLLAALSSDERLLATAATVEEAIKRAIDETARQT